MNVNNNYKNDENDLNKFLGQLGKTTTQQEYQQQYNSDILFAIPREHKRLELGINNNLNIFSGVDIWNAYEFSWLNLKGKPQIAIVQFIIDANSLCIIESKSFKLYLNSFNQTKFNSIQEIKQILIKDITQKIQGRVNVEVYISQEFNNIFKNQLIDMSGICLDRLDIEIDTYEPNKKYLRCENTIIVEEILYSNLLKSNCLVTGQPDWASVQIGYTGKQINQEGLLNYIIGFRNHQEFHEQCVERIFYDIMQQCQPIKLWVYAQYTRRGGLDINPFRSNFSMPIPKFIRHARQ